MVVYSTRIKAEVNYRSENIVYHVIQANLVLDIPISESNCSVLGKTWGLLVTIHYSENLAHNTVGLAPKTPVGKNYYISQSLQISEIQMNLPRTSTAESNRLHKGYNSLKQENEEEHHEVEWWVAPEGLVDGPVPANEAKRCQQNEV